MKKNLTSKLAKGLVAGVGQYIGESTANAIVGALGLASNPNEGIEDAIADLKKVLGDKMDVMIGKLEEIRAELHLIHTAIKDLDEHVQDNARYTAWVAQDLAVRDTVVKIDSLWNDCIYNRRDFDDWAALATEGGGALQLGDTLLEGLGAAENNIIDLFVDFLNSDAVTGNAGWRKNSSRYLAYLDYLLHYAYLAFIMAKAVEKEPEHRLGIIQSVVDRFAAAEPALFESHMNVLVTASLFATQAQGPKDFGVDMGPWPFEFRVVPRIIPEPRDNLSWAVETAGMSMPSWWGSPELADPWGGFEDLCRTYRPVWKCGSDAFRKTFILSVFSTESGRTAAEGLDLPSHIRDWQRWLTPSTSSVNGQGAVRNAEIHFARPQADSEGRPFFYGYVRCVFFLDPGDYKIFGDQSRFPVVKDSMPGGNDRLTCFADGYLDLVTDDPYYFSPVVADGAKLQRGEYGVRMITVRDEPSGVELWQPYMGLPYFELA